MLSIDHKRSPRASNEKGDVSASDSDKTQGEPQTVEVVYRHRGSAAVEVLWVHALNVANFEAAKVKVRSAFWLDKVAGLLQNSFEREPRTGSKSK